MWGACGCCAVIVNGDAIAACMTLTIEMDGCLAMKDNGYRKQEVKALIKRMVAAM